MVINGRKIGRSEEPYIIAEMSNNHNGDFDRAIDIIDKAIDSGADAIKIQTYTPESLTIDCNKDDFIVKDPLWRGLSYYQLYKSIAAPIEWTSRLFGYARDKGISIFSSPFDVASIELLESLDCPAYKVASFESKDPHFIKSLVKTGKPLIVSTGVSTWFEILRTKEWLDDFGCKSYSFLHCISSYPAVESDMNLAALDRMKKEIDIIGLSDHSLGDIAVLAAVAKGASIIEKHFTISRSDGGPDAAFSLEPNEFRSMVELAKRVWASIGTSEVLDQVRKGNQHARSLYIVSDVNEGDVVSLSNVSIIRPGFGLSPIYLDAVLGKRFKKKIEKGSRLSWELIE